MSKRKNLNAYVRYDGNNKMIPGSMIIRKKKPYGKFKQLINPSEDICCPPLQSCGSAGYWTENTELIDGYSYNPSSGVSVTDANCNIYKLGGIYGVIPETGFTTDYTPVVEKFDASGTLLWQRVIYYTDVESGDITNVGSTIQLGVDNSLYVLSSGSIAKMDLDGNILWTKDYYSSTNVSRMVEMVTPPSGRVYVTYQINDQGDPANWYVSVSEINPSNGNVLNTSTLSLDIPGLVTPQDVYYGYTAAYDSEGNILAFLNAYNNPDVSNYVCAVYKLDADLNTVWFKALVPPGGFTEYIDSEPTALVVDSQNNIIIGMWWASAVMKLDPSGNILWQTFIGSAGFEQESFNVVGVTIDDEDNVYVATDSNINTFPGILPPFALQSLIVTKFNPEGVAQFAYTITDPLAYYNFWMSLNSSRTMSHRSDSFLLTGSTYREGIPSTTVFKLPFTDLGGNTYGGIVFINIFPYMVYTPSTFTTSDADTITDALSLVENPILTAFSNTTFNTVTTSFDI